MKVRYNVTGGKRKALVKVISDTTGAKAVYKFMPTCNYEIDYFTVTKDGTLEFDDRADSEEVEQVLKPSPPQVLNVSRRTARKKRSRNYPRSRQKRHRAKTWGLRWRFRWIRCRSET